MPKGLDLKGGTVPRENEAEPQIRDAEDRVDSSPDSIPAPHILARDVVPAQTSEPRAEAENVEQGPARPPNSSDFKAFLETVFKLDAARETETSKLEDDVTFCRMALKDNPRERAPLAWAALQNNLANALVVLDDRKGLTSGLDEAVARYREALKERTRERTPLDWVTIQNNLGRALVLLAERKGAVPKLAEAAAIKREARDWAKATGDEGIDLMRRAEVLGDKDMAQTALLQIDMAVSTIRDGDHAPLLAAYYEEQLPKARALVDRLSGR